MCYARLAAGIRRRHRRWCIHNVPFNNTRDGDLMPWHAPHMPSIKCDPVMSRASSVLVTSKAAIRRESISHRGFGSALVAEHGARSARFGPSLPGHQHNMPNILLW